MGTRSFPASCHFRQFTLRQWTLFTPTVHFISDSFRGNNPSILLYLSFSLSLFFVFVVVVVNFNNRDSLQIAILPCILCNSANITLITLFKLYSCSKSFSNVTIDHGSPFQPPGVLQKTSWPATVSLRNWFEWNQINADHHFSRSRGSKTLESTKMASLHITSCGYFSSTRNKRGKVSDSAQAYAWASVSRWSVSRVIIAYYRILY